MTAPSPYRQVSDDPGPVLRTLGVSDVVRLPFLLAIGSVFLGMIAIFVRSARSVSDAVVVVATAVLLLAVPVGVVILLRRQPRLTALHEGGAMIARRGVTVFVPWRHLSGITQRIIRGQGRSAGWDTVHYVFDFGGENPSIGTGRHARDFVEEVANLAAARAGLVWNAEHTVAVPEDSSPRPPEPLLG